MAIEYPTRDTLMSLGSTAQASVLVEKAQSRSPHNRTFLSHSSKDQALLPGVIRILENHGAIVYIDKLDTSLPVRTSRKTAALLRDRVKSAKKFVLLATDNSKDSRWAPWELGLADGYKNPKNVAIFPSVASQTDKDWTEREYLGIYDRIVRGGLEGFPNNVWMVWNQETNTATELSRWLKH